MDRAPFSRYLVGALLAGGAAALINVAHSLIYGAATGVSHPLVAPANVAVSSIVPMLLGAVVWWGLARVTAKAGLILTVLALASGVMATLAGLAQDTFPDGTPKPPGFQGLVQPMHAVVPLAFILVVPWWLRRAGR